MEQLHVDIFGRNFTRRDLFEIWQQQKGKDSSTKCQHLQNVIRSKLESEGHAQETLNNVQREIYRYCTELSQRWQNSSRIVQKFLRKNCQWLNQHFQLPIAASEDLPSTSSAGRPHSTFDDSSERTKRRKTKELREQRSTTELVFATQMSLRSAGKTDAAKLIIEAINTTPTRASRMREAWMKRDKNVSMPYSPDEALALFIETKLTKSQYQKIRLQAKLKNADIYPSYKRIRAAKEQCYPTKDSITISESAVEVQLQPLLDHTVSRIIQSQEDVFRSVPVDIPAELILISKWGCDGSTGHSEYKQKFAEGGGDTDMFITSFVPIQLYAITSAKKIIFWQNPRPSSVRYCRPIRIQYKKETTQVSQEEVEYVENPINSLDRTQVTIADKKLFVSHQLLLTMIDGKICNSVTSTSSAQKCYVCGATPTQMNNFENIVKRVADVNTYRFGLSTLHAWIRFFECFLHISYRLDFKKWQARGDTDRESLKIRKLSVQQQFKSELGLLVDHVRPGGSGTSNDGNTARRFFRNFQVSAKITNINETLIRRSGVILQALSSGFGLNSEAFDNYAKETAKLFVQEYPWFYMPASVHKILIHGAEIVAHAIIPIGQLSEAAQESRNKDLKLYRRSHTRKSSRENTNADLLNMLLVSSDPLITSLRQLPQKGRQTYSEEVLQLLAPPEQEEELFDSIISTSEDDSLSEHKSDSDSDN